MRGNIQGSLYSTENVQEIWIDVQDDAELKTQN